MNRELLERTMQYIEDHPEEHYQGMWFKKTECGTAACFAGWACLLSGYQPNFERDAWFAARDCSYYVQGDDRFAKDVAADLLGIGYADADVLFDADNSVNALKLMVKDLLNGEPLNEVGEYLQ